MLYINFAVTLPELAQLLGKKCTDPTPGVILDTKQLVIGTVLTISISLPSSRALPADGSVINKLDY